MFNKIILNYGYVESSCPFIWVFSCRGPGFSTRYDAAQSLALDFLKAYKESFEYSKRKDSSVFKKCCIKAKKDVENKFCPKCAKSLEIQSDLSYEDIEEWLRQNSNTNYDDWEASSFFGCSYGTWDVSDDIIGLSGENMVDIRYAEKILPALLHGIGLGDEFDLGIVEDLLHNTTLEKFKQSVEDNDASIWG